MTTTKSDDKNRILNSVDAITYQATRFEILNKKLLSMKKFNMSDIQKTPINISKLEVQSFEMNVYLVKLHQHDVSGFVYDNNDRPMRFHNSQQIRDAFELCEVEQAVMVHDSPYDEMVGNPNKPEQSMEMPFSMQQPY